MDGLSAVKVRVHLPGVGIASGLASVHAFELAPIERRAHQEQRRPVHAELLRQLVHVRPVYVEYVASL